jgi:hypothetical protein
VVKEGLPISVRLTVLSEKRVRIFAIESSKSLNATIRYLVDRGLEAIQAEANAPSPSVAPTVGRRVLSRGVE